MVEKRLFHSVAEQIVGLIDDGNFPAGVRLPSERELAQRFGVSRISIRDAKIALQAIGRLEIKASSGFYVAENRSVEANQFPIVNAFELTEARQVFESEAAALAALNIRDEDLQQLDELLDQMASPDTTLAAEADLQFHAVIARASNNAAIVYTIETLSRMREQVPELKPLYELICNSDSGHRAKEHRAIFDALKAHDPIATRGAMRAHFNRLLTAMLEITEIQAMEELQQRALENRLRFLAPAHVA